ncbi:MAG TPA: hypothetical protein VMU32_01345 [Solirubrobacteraceae bacterium]|nr:hypothetical protein [Solirubrobacteraceae bacterium]
MSDEEQTDEHRPLGRIYYHQDAHARWAGRHLHFWFLSARSVYERHTFRHELKEVAEELGITSYATYELIGTYDLMIRMYLNAAESGRFRKAVKEHLEPAQQNSFRVEEVARHWVWAEDPEDRGAIYRPIEEVLCARYPRSEVALLNDQENNSEERRRLIEAYEDLHLVREVVPSDGIKIAIAVGIDSRDERELATVRERLCGWIDHSDRSHYERSLYVADSDQKQQFLVMCRIPHGDFRHIRDWLIEPIGQIVGALTAHTVTYPVVSTDFVCFQERMELTTEERPDLTKLMQGHEQWQFEVKGSLLAPLDRWVKEGEPLEERNSYALKVISEVVGLLNSGGGVLVIGALETQSYEKSERAMAYLGQFPEVGPYRVIGLQDPTYRDLGWDKWHLRLKELLESRIGEPPGVLVQAREGELEGQPVAILTVDEPRESQMFYLREARDRVVYYGRVGTACEALYGPDAQRHHQAVLQHRRNQRRQRHRGADPS